MSDSEVAMARTMIGKYRHSFLRKVSGLVNTETRTILDIGCGPGAMIPLLHEKVPHSKIVGLDLSKYMLKEVNSRFRDTSTSTVQGLIPRFPFRGKVFDAIIAVQCLSEVHEFIGKKGLIEAFAGIKELLRKKGRFVLLDHQNPGEKLVDVKTISDTIKKMEYFKQRFNPREIKYEILDGNSVQITLRDLYDFITKTWAFGTALEEEEMNESHTTFTCDEYMQLIEAAGLEICTHQSVVDISSYFRRNKIKYKSQLDLPGRYALISAKC